LLVAFFCLISFFDATAQTDTNPPWAKYAIHTDLGLLGYGGVFTVNFEMRIWTNKKALQLLARSGFGSQGLGDTASSSSVYGVPLNLTLLLGKKMHFIELTAGAIVGFETSTYYGETTKGMGAWPLVDIGYRFQHLPKGIILRVKIGTGGLGGGIGVAF
jgi:hypothetical protein